jgi:hypothetical protein
MFLSGHKLRLPGQRVADRRYDSFEDLAHILGKRLCTASKPQQAREFPSLPTPVYT